MNILRDSSLREEQKDRIANLMIMSLVVIHTEGTLRQGKQEL